MAEKPVKKIPKKYPPLQALFDKANADTGISLKEWCNQQDGLNYDTARRYLTQKTTSPTPSNEVEKPENCAEETAQTAQTGDPDAQFAQPIGSPQTRIRLKEFLQGMMEDSTITAKQRIAYIGLFEGKSPRDVAAEAGYKSVRNVQMMLKDDRFLRLKDQYNEIAYLDPLAANANTLATVNNLIHADFSQIQGVHLESCRYCWGKNGRYQYIDEQEYLNDLEDWEDEQRLLPDGDKKKGIGKPNNRGGYGFRRLRRKNENCYRCLGRGIPHHWVMDSRDFNDQQKMLVQTTRVTRNGFEHVLIDKTSLINQKIALSGGNRGALANQKDQFDNDVQQERFEMEVEAHEARMDETAARTAAIANKRGDGLVININGGFEVPGAVPQGMKDGDEMTPEEVKEQEALEKAQQMHEATFKKKSDDDDE